MDHKEHSVSMETLAKEAERLLRLQITLREELLAHKGILPEEAGNEQAFSQDAAAKQIEVLHTEATKLAQREAVLVIVGTMKAGKSTSINAIIGTEALPTRNRAMTTLPTLIRHKPGQSVPVLEFSNRKPLDKLVKELKPKVRSRELQKRRKRDGHFNDLVAWVEEGRNFRSKYQGTGEIFEFLEDLNDLARLAGELGIDFPFADYDEIHEVPVIEVEFAYLQETKEATGSLALLDTPGPNEYGQPHLRRLLKDQLAKATAVLAVLDYTQLKSDADEDIRNELEAIKDIMDGRAYALVNKFDQWDAHSDDAKQVRSLVAEDLMDEVVSDDAVFPASAKIAYLAGRAKHVLRHADRLPDPNKEDWVADFGKKAFGISWDRDINKEKVIEAADKLWESSQFRPLLERVIGTAHANATLLAMDSAASKLVDQASRLENHLLIRSEGLKHDIADLESKAKDLRKDIEELDKNHKETEKRTDTLLAELSGSVKADAGKVSREAKKKVEAYFNKGQVVQREKFKSKSDAKRRIKKMFESVSEIAEVAKRTLQKKVDLRIDEFERRFESVQKEGSETVLIKMQERLGQDGFNVTPPAIRTPRLKLKSVADNAVDSFIREKTERKTKLVPQEGLWGTVKRFILFFFPTDGAGYDLIEEKETLYHVDFRVAKRKILDGFLKSLDALSEEAVREVKKEVEGSVDRFFDELKVKVEELRQNFIHSKGDKEFSHEKQTKLRRVLTTYQKRAHVAAQDCEGLRKDITLTAQGEHYTAGAMR